MGGIDKGGSDKYQQKTLKPIEVIKKPEGLVGLQKGLEEVLNETLDTFDKIPGLFSAVKNLGSALIDMYDQYNNNEITLDTVKSRLKSLTENFTLTNIGSTIDEIVKGFLDNIRALFNGSYEAGKAIGNILVFAILGSTVKLITKLPKGFVLLLSKAGDILKGKNKLSSISFNMREDYIFQKEVYKNA